MANRITVTASLSLSGTGKSVNLTPSFSFDQSGLDYQAQPLAVSANSGWTNWSAPSGLADAKLFLVAVPSDAAYSVRHATVDGSSNKIVVNTIPAGGFVLLWATDIAKVYFQHTGASGTVTIEIFAVES
jgi:hypothetical protein